MDNNNLIDYARPTMMAEKYLKDLHNAMLENRYDDAMNAAKDTIVEVRWAIAAIRDAKERHANRA